MAPIGSVRAPAAGAQSRRRVRDHRLPPRWIEGLRGLKPVLLAMGHDLGFRTALAAGLGLVAAAGNLIGGYFVVHQDWPRKFLQYFLALGAGYMLALSGGVTLYVAATDLLPEVNREPNWRMALLVFAGVVSLLIMRYLFHV